MNRLKQVSLFRSVLVVLITSGLQTSAQAGALQCLYDQLRVLAPARPSAADAELAGLKLRHQTWFGELAIEPRHLRYSIDEEERVVKIVYGKPELTHPPVLAETMYTVRGNSIQFDVVMVNEKARNQGVQQLVFKKTLEMFPNVSRIDSGALASTNQAVVKQTLMNKFKKLREAKGLTGQALEEGFAGFLLQLEQYQPAQYKSWLQEAAESTPSYKAFKKLGFEQPCGAMPYHQGFDDDGEFWVNLQFSLCRP